VDTEIVKLLLKGWSKVRHNARIPMDNEAQRVMLKWPNYPSACKWP
jgi:hypothetical protein